MAGGTVELVADAVAQNDYFMYLRRRNYTLRTFLGLPQPYGRVDELRVYIEKNRHCALQLDPNPTDGLDL